MTAEFKKCWMLKIYTGEDVIVGNDPLYRTILEEARRDAVPTVDLDDPVGQQS